MSIKLISTDDLRKMSLQEGIIFPGCGGDLQEWVDGINEMFEESGILLDNTKFTSDNCRKFNNGDITYLLFPFDENVHIDISRLSVWRLQTYSTFGASWMTDYVENNLGGFLPGEVQKPDCKLIGEDGNIFNLIGLTARCLKENDMPNEAKEMTERVTSSGSYAEALSIISEYVNITGDEDEEDLYEDEEMFCRY